MPKQPKKLESHNNKLHVKKDDTVFVITGKDKGKKGRVIAAFPRENRVLVEGVNMINCAQHCLTSAAGMPAPVPSMFMAAPAPALGQQS